MSSPILSAQNAQSNTTLATRTGSFASLTHDDIAAMGYAGDGRNAYHLQQPRIQAYVSGSAEGVLQAEIGLTICNGDTFDAVSHCKHALLHRFGLTGENLTAQQERERGFVIGLFFTVGGFVEDAPGNQHPAPGLLAAAQRLQALIQSGDICIRYPAPTNTHDQRREALDDFAAALAAAEGAP